MLRKMIICLSLVCMLSIIWYGCVTRPTVKEDTVREEIPAPDVIERQFRNAFEEYKEGDLEGAIGEKHRRAKSQRHGWSGLLNG